MPKASYGCQNGLSDLSKTSVCLVCSIQSASDAVISQFSINVESFQDWVVGSFEFNFNFNEYESLPGVLVFLLTKIYYIFTLLLN